MAILTVCNHKGGTGKTTTSVHLAAAFGLMGHRVLLVDLDPQGFLTRTLGAEEPLAGASSLALLDADGDLRKTPVQSLRHFDLLGASMSMTREQRRLTRPTDVFWMRETVSQGHDYDLILVDTAAAVSVYTMNALVASDAVVIPVTPEYQPVVGAEQTWQTCRLVRNKLNPGLQEPRFLLTQVDGRLSRHTRYTSYLRERYGKAVLNVPIRTSSSLAVAARDGRTVFNAPRMSRGGLDYANSAAEVAERFFPPLARPAPIAGAPDETEESDDMTMMHEGAEAAESSTAPAGRTAPASRTAPVDRENLKRTPESRLGLPSFGSIPVAPTPPTPLGNNRTSPPFRHAPVPGKAASFPNFTSGERAHESAAMPSLEETLEETKQVAEAAAEEADAAIRSQMPSEAPPASEPSAPAERTAPATASEALDSEAPSAPGPEASVKRAQKEPVVVSEGRSEREPERKRRFLF